MEQTSDTSQAAKPRIGFLGLGVMGSRMARRLIDAGYPLTVYNHTQEKTREFQKAGASVALTPADAARASDIVISMLSTDDAVREVYRGEHGVFEGAHEGLLALEMSTITPEVARALAETGERVHVIVLDAPVSGSTPQAESGDLAIFVGGDHDAFERCRPVLQVLGKHIFYIGPSGTGKMMKVVVNTLLGLGVQAVAEALALGEKAGLKRDMLIEVLGNTSVVSPSQKAKLLQNAGPDSYMPTFPLSLMSKDYALMLEEAYRLAVPMPATAAAHQIALIDRDEIGGEDFSVVIRTMRRLAGVE